MTPDDNGVPSVRISSPLPDGVSQETIGVRGGLHSQASQLLSELAAAAVQNGVCEVSQKSAYLTGMVQRLEAAVASGNANVARRWSAMGAGYGLPRGLGGV